jgi:hypothetical protein
MAPATKARGGPTQVWTREKVITALLRYAELYGPDFTASAFSPSTAKWRDEPEAIERYMLGDPETGESWPSLNAVKDRFGGSFNAAREAAGLPANKPGPAKRRAKGEHAPVRDVRHVTRVLTRGGDGKELERARARIGRLEAKVERLKEQLAAKPKTVVKTKTQTKTETRTVRVTDNRALERARQRARRAVENLELARKEAKTNVDEARSAEREARDAATRSASKLERAEATIAELRAERRELKSELTRAQDQLAAARAEAAREPIVIREEAPEAEVLAQAVRRAHEAEVRAATAERQMAEQGAAITGERRRLTQAELAELRRRVPVGEALVARALRALAKARGVEQRRAALYELASAAISWRERL